MKVIKKENVPSKCIEIEKALESDWKATWLSWGYSPVLVKPQTNIYYTPYRIIPSIWNKSGLLIETANHYSCSNVVGVSYTAVLAVKNGDEFFYKKLYIKITERYSDVKSLNIDYITVSGSIGDGWYRDNSYQENTVVADLVTVMKELKETNRYLYEFCEKYPEHVGEILTFPALEILDKAGYKITDRILKKDVINVYTRYDLSTTSDLGSFRRCFKSGSSPKEIIQMPKRYHKEMKEIDDVGVWDNMRKLVKNNTAFSIDSFLLIIRNREYIRNINNIYTILNSKWDNRPVFTTTSLVTYLERIDTFEAIETKEGLCLLSDYLRMCKELHIKPKIDGDSLKREHDVCARLSRQKKNKDLEEKLNQRCIDLQEYNYTEAVYMIRGIRDYDDLIDEAKQQHNCVASYARRISTGESLIYVMRETKNPDCSLITIELSPDHKTVRQKFLAYNQSIRNKSQTDFIERWLAYIKNKKKAV